MKTRIYRHCFVDPKAWNNYILSSEEGTIFQSLQWANFFKEYLKWEPLYFLTENNQGKACLCLLAFKRPYGWERIFERPLDFLALPLVKGIFPAISWSYGPIVLCKDEYSAASDSLLKAIEDMVKREKIFFIEGKPAVHYLSSHNDRESILDDKLRNLGYAFNEKGTYLLNLSSEIEQIWHGFEASARKSVNKAKRENISVARISALQELREYYKFEVECMKEQGRKFYSFKNQELLWKYLRPEGNIEFFVARHNNKIISGLGVWAFNGIITEFCSVQSRTAFDNKLYGNDLIKWEIINWAKENNYRIYDLAGAYLSASSQKEINLKQFKKKWGGTLKTFYYWHKKVTGGRSMVLSGLRGLVGRIKAG